MSIKNNDMRRLVSMAMSFMFAIGLTCAADGRSYYLDSAAGNDSHDGQSPQTAWATLKKASGAGYKGGDHILLKRGSRFNGKLDLNGIKGTEGAPVVIDAYGEDKAAPMIDAAGYIAGVNLKDCAHVEVKNLEITSDGGKEIDAAAQAERYGVFVSNSSYVNIANIHAHTIFATVQTKSEGKDGSTAYGYGVQIEKSDHLRVSGCTIKKVGRYGINAIQCKNLEILNNTTDHNGGSGIKMSKCTDVVIEGNVVDHSGSFIDKRMHGRGSGSWVIGCTNVLYERNRFLNSSGKLDSCGVHIDFGNKNVVIQRCFSMNNEGGFIEILGNNYNCAYRYNISVNDGFRKKGEDHAIANGKIIFLSGYVGEKNTPSGPFQSYIYNNTIYVKKGERACFSIFPTAQGAVVTNNIFHLLGNATLEADRSKSKNAKESPTGIVWANNVYVSDEILPSSNGVRDSSPIIGDAQFRNPGGTSPEDYIPANVKLLRNTGQRLVRLPGDTVGLTIGFEVKEDFFGNPIIGAPDIGAVELKE